MKLSVDQSETLDREGYLFLPDLFSAEEVTVLRAELPSIYARQGPEIVREKSGAVRTAFGVHTYNDVYWKLSRHPRLVEPAMQVLGGPVYIHQFKVNAKAAFDGDVWQWHQDYGTWARDDLMPEARAMNLAVFLDEVTEFNGPLMFIPGSHKAGRIDASHDTNTTSYPLWTIDNATIERLVAEGGIASPKGKAGSAVFFHCNLVHGSAPNMSPWGRDAVYFSANAVENAIRRFERPDYIAHRDFTPVEPLADNCLLAGAAASRAS
jgi:ectoine hydroxylase